MTKDSIVSDVRKSNDEKAETLKYVMNNNEIFLIAPIDKIGQISPKVKHRLMQGYSYIVKESTSIWSFDVFKNGIAAKVPGLCLTSTYPKKIREIYGLGDTQIYWLSEASGSEEKALNPRRLEFEITRTISDFVKNKNGSLILIDGLEYLLLVNGFEKIINFIKSISDIMSQNKATLIVPVNPEALDKKELTIFERAFDKIEDRIKR
ncbi:MAG: DUF835 domain-containing protein [Thermoplasmata archaeon]